MKVRVKPHNEIYYKLIIDNYIALYRKALALASASDC